MPRIYNGTPHPINIVANSEYRDDIRKYVVPEGTEPKKVYRPKKKEG